MRLGNEIDRPVSSQNQIHRVESGSSIRSAFRPDTRVSSAPGMLAYMRTTWASEYVEPAEPASRRLVRNAASRSLIIDINQMPAHITAGPGSFSHPIIVPRCCLPTTTTFTMATSSRQPAQGQNSTLSTLNEAIQDLNLARNATSPTPAKAVCGSVSALLTTIRVRVPPAYTSQPPAEVHRTR